MKVLLVEDNPADQRKILSLLDASRVEVLRTDTLASAQMALMNLRVDAVLADLSLEDSRGVETVIALHRTAPMVPIIVLSGHEDIQMARNCVKEGASSYVVKSVELSAETLERELVYAVERQARTASIAGLLHQVVQDDLLQPHVRALDHSIDEVNDYLRRNYPGAAAEVARLFEKHHAPFAMQELRGVGKGTPEAQVATFKQLAKSVEVHKLIKKPTSAWLLFLSYFCGVATAAAWCYR